MFLCKYKHIFGKENEGVHSYRLFNIAIYDLIFTILGAALISFSFRISFWMTLIIVIILGIILHRVFCVNTTVNMMIFGKVQ